MIIKKGKIPAIIREAEAVKIWYIELVDPKTGRPLGKFQTGMRSQMMRFPNDGEFPGEGKSDGGADDKDDDGGAVADAGDTKKKPRIHISLGSSSKNAKADDVDDLGPEKDGKKKSKKRRRRKKSMGEDGEEDEEAVPPELSTPIPRRKRRKPNSPDVKESEIVPSDGKESDDADEADGDDCVQRQQRRCR